MTAKRRTKGSGSVFRSGSGYYVFKYYDANGKPHQKTLRTKNKLEAEKRAPDMLKAILASDKEEVLFQSAQSRKIINSKKLPFSKIWKEFLKTKPTASEGTLENYKRILNEFCDWICIARPHIDSLTQVDLEIATSFLEKVWQSGISANTYNYKRGAMGTITKALQNKFNIESNCWLKTARKKGVQQKRLPLNAEQVKKMLELIDDKETSLKYHYEMVCLIKLCLFAGMRLYDAINLSWDNVDLTNNFITYVPKKTQRTSGVSAQVPILMPLLKALDHLKSKDEKFILPEIQNHYSRNPDYIKKALLKIIHEVTGSLQNNSAVQSLYNRSLYGVHSLRHTFATEAAKAGVSSIKLSRMLGDTIRTIDRFYVDVDLSKESLPEFAGMPSSDGVKKIAFDTSKGKLIELIDKLSEQEILEIKNKYS